MKKINHSEWITKTMEFDYDINPTGQAAIDRLEKNSDPIRQAGFIKSTKQSILLEGGASIKFENSEIIKFGKKNEK